MTTGLLIFIGFCLLTFSIILIIWNIHEKKYKGLLLIILAVYGLVMMIYGFSGKDFSPESRYQELVKQIEKDNKKLEKFFIDHPEFKENNIEIK